MNAHEMESYPVPSQLLRSRKYQNMIEPYSVGLSGQTKMFKAVMSLCDVLKSLCKDNKHWEEDATTSSVYRDRVRISICSNILKGIILIHKRRVELLLSAAMPYRVFTFPYNRKFCKVEIAIPISRDVEFNIDTHPEQLDDRSPSLYSTVPGTIGQSIVTAGSHPILPHIAEEMRAEAMTVGRRSDHAGKIDLRDPVAASQVQTIPRLLPTAETLYVPPPVASPVFHDEIGPLDLPPAIRGPLDMPAEMAEPLDALTDSYRLRGIGASRNTNVEVTRDPAFDNMNLIETESQYLARMGKISFVPRVSEPVVDPSSYYRHENLQKTFVVAVDVHPVLVVQTDDTNLPSEAVSVARQKRGPLGNRSTSEPERRVICTEPEIITCDETKEMTRAAEIIEQRNMSSRQSDEPQLTELPRPRESETEDFERPELRELMADLGETLERRALRIKEVRVPEPRESIANIVHLSECGERIEDKLSSSLEKLVEERLEERVDFEVPQRKELIPTKERGRREEITEAPVQTESGLEKVDEVVSEETRARKHVREQTVSGAEQPLREIVVEGTEELDPRKVEVAHSGIAELIIWPRTVFEKSSPLLREIMRERDHLLGSLREVENKRKSIYFTTRGMKTRLNRKNVQKTYVSPIEIFSVYNSQQFHLFDPCRTLCGDDILDIDDVISYINPDYLDIFVNEIDYVKPPLKLLLMSLSSFFSEGQRTDELIADRSEPAHVVDEQRKSESGLQLLDVPRASIGSRRLSPVLPHTFQDMSPAQDRTRTSLIMEYLLPAHRRSDIEPLISSANLIDSNIQAVRLPDLHQLNESSEETVERARYVGSSSVRERIVSVPASVDHSGKPDSLSRLAEGTYSVDQTRKKAIVTDSVSCQMSESSAVLTNIPAVMGDAPATALLSEPPTQMIVSRPVDTAVPVDEQGYQISLQASKPVGTAVLVDEQGHQIPYEAKLRSIRQADELETMRVTDSAVREDVPVLVTEEANTDKRTGNVDLHSIPWYKKLHVDPIYEEQADADEPRAHRRRPYITKSEVFRKVSNLIKSAEIAAIRFSNVCPPRTTSRHLAAATFRHLLGFGVCPTSMEKKPSNQPQKITETSETF